MVAMPEELKIGSYDAISDFTFRVGFVDTHNYSNIKQSLQLTEDIPKLAFKCIVLNHITIP